VEVQDSQILKVQNVGGERRQRSVVENEILELSELGDAGRDRRDLGIRPVDGNCSVVLVAGDATTLAEIIAVGAGDFVFLGRVADKGHFVLVVSSSAGKCTDRSNKQNSEPHVWRRKKKK